MLSVAAAGSITISTAHADTHGDQDYPQTVINMGNDNNIAGRDNTVGSGHTVGIGHTVTSGVGGQTPPAIPTATTVTVRNELATALTNTGSVILPGVSVTPRNPIPPQGSSSYTITWNQSDTAANRVTLAYQIGGDPTRRVSISTYIEDDGTPETLCTAPSGIQCTVAGPQSGPEITIS
ncbi:hypothetical protein C6N75_02515 [Streptomyces solincola]|uniref:Uncharacterized protein n=2 Tax=Streptomyces solincola TaxID=2100817 RepID=A0A2S9Q287_9ACTN|nr:hypothetical protein C6N75_02515 [Streptomyces solincola]